MKKKQKPFLGEKDSIIANGTKYLFENITNKVAINILKSKKHAQEHVIPEFFRTIDPAKKNFLCLENFFAFPITYARERPTHKPPSKQMRSSLIHAAALLCPILLNRTDIKYGIQNYNDIYYLVFIFPSSTSIQDIFDCAQKLINVKMGIAKMKNAKILKTLISDTDFIRKLTEMRPQPLPPEKFTYESLNFSNERNETHDPLDDPLNEVNDLFDSTNTNPKMETLYTNELLAEMNAFLDNKTSSKRKNPKIKTIRLQALHNEFTVNASGLKHAGVFKRAYPTKPAHQYNLRPRKAIGLKSGG
ncbi:MAG: hypothetical protein A3F12_06970 [Gammaproteobacteria bacterium RIFCSPHIGHO2_12_FULL_38_14]|nr:MAG: hypothetical protein A3F12_06970 [Gammaproteobacteria bacterium RIFCSPHIGHO2_12_FULL_38_14]